MRYVRRASIVVLLSVIALCLVSEGMQALLQPHIANLQVLHNEQYGVNITWEYLDGDTAAGHAVGGNVTFTVQFYKLLIDPRCCGPHPTTCTRITQRWCTVRGLDDSDGYHFQVISEQGSYHSNVSSVGFFLNGNNAPAGCPIENSVYPWAGCQLQVHFRLGKDYTSLVIDGSVNVVIRYSAHQLDQTSMQLHVLNMTLVDAPYLNYTLDLMDAVCNTTYDVSWEAVTGVSGVPRTTGQCFHFTTSTSPSKVPGPPHVSVVTGKTTATSLTVQWTIDSDRAGANAPTGYILCQRQYVNSSWSVSGDQSSCKQVHGPDQNVAVWSPLSPGALYELNVTALNMFGVSASANMVLAATLDTVPSWGGGAIHCTEVSMSSTLIFWPKLEWNALPSHRVDIVVNVTEHLLSPHQKGASDSFELSSMATFTLVSNLVPGVLYDIAVTAQTSTSRKTLYGECSVGWRSTASTSTVRMPATQSSSDSHSVSSTTPATTATMKSPQTLAPQWIILMATGGLLVAAVCVALLIRHHWRAQQRRSRATTELRRRSAERRAEEYRVDENHYSAEPRRLVARSRISQASTGTIASLVSISPELLQQPDTASGTEV